MEFDNKTLDVGCQTPFKIQVLVFKISENGKNYKQKGSYFYEPLKFNYSSS